MKKYFFPLLCSLITANCAAQNFHPIGSFSKFVPRLQFSHNGKLLAAPNMAGGTRVGYLELYDVEAGAIVASIPGDAIFAAFSADDKKLFARESDHTVAIYDISDIKNPKILFEYPAEEAQAGDISDDGTIIAFGCDDGQAFVVNTVSKKVLATSRPFPSVTGFTCCYNSCKFCPVWGIKLLDPAHYLVAGADANGRVSVLGYDGHTAFTSPYLGEISGWSADTQVGHLLVNGIDRPIYGLYTGFVQTGKVSPRVSTLQFTPSGKYIIGIGEGKIFSFDENGKKLESNSDKTYLKNIKVSAVSDKNIAFVLDNTLILGSLEGLVGK